MLDEFNLVNGVTFDNHAKALSDIADETAQRLESQQPPPSTPSNSCVYARAKDGQRSLAFVVEYKAPHKLTLAHLRLGLRDMKIPKVVDHYEVPPPEAVNWTPKRERRLLREQCFVEV